MSSGGYYRSWMDKPHLDPNTKLLTEEYVQGIKEFMRLVQQQPDAKNGFSRNYKVWYLHGETGYEYGSTSEPQPISEFQSDIRLEESRTDIDYGVGTEQMVHDHYRGEEPNPESRRFFDMLDAGKQPLYQNCRDGHSALSSATRLMGIKTDYNLAEECMDAITDFVKGILPEDNVAPGSYYEVQKLVAGLQLPYEVIDVCIDNCMIYWRADETRNECKFCGKPRFQETRGRVPIPFKRMWYLPLTERLKRLYQCERTAKAMRWRFLPPDHPYRRSRNAFTKNKQVFDGPPVEVSGEDLLKQFRYFDAERTPDVGGHENIRVSAVGELHNWHKKSIFWDLPYWESHLLRHNLDVMHIEKNFFDNLMNTVLNIQGKTKDNLKSRLDLVDICDRPELHVDENEAKESLLA
ncbi:uncharacterized protein LOC130511354 [Raphanus sativus]|uniref:Uncharacterized protein LOC130511354 n=1 Tax=Raphanus sativus TaxID=3726 RepID=A0A9W3DKY2_RAPSA|nr:uncharacterized protein LOC130511354 [Raphanus sativus]